MELFKNRIITLNKVDSTNQYILDNIAYMQLGDVFFAEYQILGRGRLGKIWFSSFGKNICLSMYWKLHRVPLMIVEFSLMISIVVANILRSVGVAEIKIKWPNDLYVYNKKLAGILIEMVTKVNGITHVVIGLGINFSKFSYIKNTSINWISLEDIGVAVDFNFLVIKLVNTLRKKLKIFERYGLKPFIFYWKFFDYLYKKSIMLSICNSVMYGIVLGISIRGELVIIDELGYIRCYSGNNISIDVLD